MRGNSGGNMAVNNTAPSGQDRPVRILSLPAAGETERVPFSTDQDLKLTFDQAATSFDRSGADLVISSGKTGTLILSDFCRPEHAGQLPRFILLSGDVVAGEDLVFVLDPESLPPPSAGHSFALGQIGLSDLLTGPDEGGGEHRLTAISGDLLPPLAAPAGDDSQSVELFLIKNGLHG